MEEKLDFPFCELRVFQNALTLRLSVEISALYLGYRYLGSNAL